MIKKILCRLVCSYNFGMRLFKKYNPFLDLKIFKCSDFHYVEVIKQENHLVFISEIFLLQENGVFTSETLNF